MVSLLFHGVPVPKKTASSFFVFCTSLLCSPLLCSPLLLHTASLQSSLLCTHRSVFCSAWCSVRICAVQVSAKASTFLSQIDTLADIPGMCLRLGLISTRYQTHLKTNRALVCGWVLFPPDIRPILRPSGHWSAVGSYFHPISDASSDQQGFGLQLGLISTRYLTHLKTNGGVVCSWV